MRIIHCFCVNFCIIFGLLENKIQHQRRKRRKRKKSYVPIKCIFISHNSISHTVNMNSKKIIRFSVFGVISYLLVVSNITLVLFSPTFSAMKMFQFTILIRACSNAIDTTSARVWWIRRSTSGPYLMCIDHFTWIFTIFCLYGWIISTVNSFYRMLPFLMESVWYMQCVWPRRTFIGFVEGKK